MPKVSVIIPTYNRPEFIKNAVKSVLNQTYDNLEIIVVDDGTKIRARKIINSINDDRIKYIKHTESKGGGAARNTGIKNSTGDYIAFLDDDDEWVPEKLAIQMNEFLQTGEDVGFCFSSVSNVIKNGIEVSQIKEGINDYSELSLKKLNGFLTVTLIIKKNVINEIGGFDESLPSHQEIDLIIRIAQKYKGLGINIPLVKVKMDGSHEQIGSNLNRKIKGRKMLLSKHINLYEKHPKTLAKHFFQIGLYYRDSGKFKEARNSFCRAMKKDFNIKYLLHYFIILFGEDTYQFIRKFYK